MRFLFEIIFCIGAAYGIGWFFSSYYGRMAQAPGDFDGLKHKKRVTGTLVLVQRVPPPESTAAVRPARDRKWLS